MRNCFISRMMLLALAMLLLVSCDSIEAEVIYYGKNAAGDIEWELVNCEGGGCQFLEMGNKYIYVAPIDELGRIPDSLLEVGSRWNLTGIVELDSVAQDHGLYRAEVRFLKYSSYKRLPNR